MKRIVLSIAAVAGGLWLISASALGLGEISVRSHLNQRFDAVIPLTSVGVDEAADLRVSLASAEDFTRAGIERSDYLSSLHFAVRTDGTPRIEITSDKLEREPYLQLLLEIHGGGNRILRQYTVLLDPPGMAPSNAQTAVAPRPITAVPVTPSTASVRDTTQTPVQPAAPPPAQVSSSEPTQSIFVEVDHPSPPPDEQSVAPRSEPVKSTVKAKPATAATSPASATATPAAPISGELYGPVKSGETLWSIATRVRGDNADVSMDQVLLSLYNSNPRAFDGGGLNGLNRGAMLSIPAVADMRTLDATDAHREVSRLRGLPAGSATPAVPPRVRKPVIEPAQITPPPPPAAAAAQAVHAAPAAPAISETKPADTEPAAPSTTVDDKSAVADHTAAATAPVDAGQASASDATVAESGNAAADTATAESPAEVPGDGETSSPEATVPPVEPTRPVKPKKTESLLQALLIPLILGLLLLFFLGWLFARWRARRAALAAPTSPAVSPSRARMPLATPSASESAIAATAAATAAAATTQKLSPQEELDRLQASISGRTQDVDTQQFQTQQLGVDTVTTTEVAAPAGDLPPVDFDLTGQFATQTVQIDLDANDPVSEADFHLAYGLYDEAALLLRQAAEKEPQRTDIGIKLAETYFAAGKTAEFTQTATELKPKLSAAEWQKLAIMGQQLDPTSTAFSDAESAAPATNLAAQTASTTTAAPADNDALDFNFDSEPEAAPVHEQVPPINLQADNGLDFKLDELELPSLDVDKHEAPTAAPDADGAALDFDLGGFDVAAAPAAAPEPSAVAAEPIAQDASSTLDFDLGDFDAGSAAGDLSIADQTTPPAAEPTADAPIEEFDFGTVSTDAGELATGDEAATKLDLARAYLEMGDSEMARGLLDEVLEQGNAQQKQDAQSLVDRLA